MQSSTVPLLAVIFLIKGSCFMLMSCQIMKLDYRGILRQKFKRLCQNVHQASFPILYLMTIGNAWRYVCLRDTVSGLLQIINKCWINWKSHFHLPFEQEFGSLINHQLSVIIKKNIISLFKWKKNNKENWDGFGSPYGTFAMIHQRSSWSMGNFRNLVGWLPKVLKYLLHCCFHIARRRSRRGKS